MARRGEDARIALVETAERLFAERGIETVSLRDVSAAAGQRNHSAAQYHFGDREGLVAAVYQYRMSIVTERRERLVASIDRDGRADDLAALVAAVIVPLVEVVVETNGWYGRFLARSRWDSFAWRILQRVPEAASYRGVADRIAGLLSHLPADVRQARVEQMLTLGVGTIAGWEWALERGMRRLSPAMLAGDLITTSLAVLTAPFTAFAATDPTTDPTTDVEPDVDTDFEPDAGDDRPVLQGVPS